MLKEFEYLSVLISLKPTLAGYKYDFLRQYFYSRNIFCRKLVQDDSVECPECPIFDSDGGCLSPEIAKKRLEALIEGADILFDE